ncbi:uncharacterized protein LOC131331807 [Rhododendron vialii]|uniref:uncharacterized protein LOC131331807 n=1 Tax=Rhododendron vialii TaxID=182163 RepID=UPI00265D8C0C|nr:uncharacterized protein LOC131331807 [Rhododendron vialii]
MASSSNQNMGALPLSFPLLNGENYDFWYVKMKTQLMSNDVWEYVQDGFEDYEGVEVALSNEQKKQLNVDNRMNAKALSMIQQGISDNLFPRIINETKAKKAWDILYNEYRGNLKVKTIKLQSLRRDYENLKMKDSELLNDYFSRLMDVVNQMKTYGEDVATQKIVEKILINLPKKYDSIVAVIENTQDLATLSVEELMGSLKTFEQRLNRQSEKSIESAFQSKFNVSTPKPHRKGSSSSHNQSRGQFSSGGNFERGRGGNDRGRGRGMNNFQSGNNFQRGNNFQARGSDESTQPRITESQTINKLITPKSKKVEGACFMLVKWLPSKRMMCGSLIVVVVTT